MASLTIGALSMLPAGAGVAMAAQPISTAKLEINLPLTPRLAGRSLIRLGSGPVSRAADVSAGLVLEYHPPLPGQTTEMVIGMGKGWFSLGGNDGERSLLLSSAAGPFPAVYYTLSKNFDTFPASATYTRMWANLADAPGRTRWLGIHYLRLELRPGLSIGAGEASLFDTHFPGDVAYYFVPLLPYYLTKKIPGLPSTHDNSLFYFDGRATLARQTQLYAAFLVNEFPMVPGAGNPALYAWQVEIDNPRWSAAYTQVRHLAYSNGNPDLVYSFRGESLGYPEGSDLDYLELNTPVPLPIHTVAGLFIQRRGEGKLNDWASDWNAWRQQQFLTGIVETWAGVHLYLRGDAARSLASSWSLDLKLGPVWNADNQTGETAFRAGVRLGMSVSL